jgi:ribosomal protein S18 acetylase RimI-like enzyme
VGFDLANDAWVVVVSPGAIVGYVQAMFEEPAAVECWGVVHPGHRGRGVGSSLLSLTEEQTGSPSYDPALWLLATAAGEPVGALVGRVWGDRGWVDYLGVLAPGRGRGIGAALLRRRFATFAGRGIRRVILNVDAENPTGAMALYEHAGMRVINGWDVWERSLAVARGS